MKRYSKEDFKELTPTLVLLIEMQQARYDCKHHGTGLTAQGLGELVEINKILDLELKNQK